MALESFNFENMQKINSNLVEMFSGFNYENLMNTFAANFRNFPIYPLSQI